MCDTLGFLDAGKAYFGKNSDRSPNEAQVLEYRSAHMPASDMVRATYVTVPETRTEIRATLLSRPTWMFGAEIGVNDRGVCIGNEAVFTRGRYAKTGLTGMDLLRLALERAESAEGAVTVITELLEQFGQGGNCGYDHDFYYDNSFLILDRSALYVLETAGRRWAVKRSERASISNRLSLGADCDAYGGGATNFKKAHFEPVYSLFSGSQNRLSSTSGALAGAKGIPDVLAALRSHAPSVRNLLCESSVKSVCMHAGGPVGDHTTASMAVELAGDAIRVFATGCSTPCIALYKPCAFGMTAGPVFAPDAPEAAAYWMERERFFRSLLFKTLPREYYAERDALERAWLSAATSAASDRMAVLSAHAVEQERAFLQRWSERVMPEGKSKRSYRNYWKKKNAALGAPRS